MTNYAILITTSIEITPGERKIRWHLRQLGYEVVIQQPPTSNVNKELDGALIVIASSVPEENAREIIEKLKLPVIALNGTPIKALGFPGQDTEGLRGAVAGKKVVSRRQPTKKRGASVYSAFLSTAPIGWINPDIGASALAWVEGEEDKVVAFGYKSGAVMESEAMAPNRRVGLFFNEADSVNLTLDGWDLFERAVAWVSSPKEFNEVFRQEWAEVKKRRRSCYGKRNRVEENRPPGNMVGLALSGGGIRSATFSLGLLQELDRLNLLRMFDYISTVSGGGYVGGWWSAWLSRDNSSPDGPKSISLTAADIRSPYEFAKAVFEGGRRLDEELKKKFQETGKPVDGSDEQFIPHEILTDEDKNQLAQKLASSLNELIAGPPLYSDNDFDNPYLTEETFELAEAPPEQQKPRLLNRLMLEEAFPKYITPLDRGLFPKEEEVEPKRTDDYLSREIGSNLAEGSLCAGKDPIHHLRLFSNYLTPRKGGLSGDTWRAVAIISRNLLLTWIILLPMLFAFVLTGQLYFVLQKNSPVEFFHNYYGRLEAINSNRKDETARFERELGEANKEYADKLSPLVDSAAPKAERDSLLQNHNDGLLLLSAEHAEKMQELEEKADSLKQQRRRFLERRLYLVVGLLLLPAGWIIITLMAWMGSTITLKPILDWVAHMLGTVCVGVLMLCGYFLYRNFEAGDQADSLSGVLSNPESVFASALNFLQSHPWWTLVAGFWVLVSSLLYIFTYPITLRKKKAKQIREWRKDLRRNKIDRASATLLVLFVVAASLLALSGFGHELAHYIWHDPGPRKGLTDYVAKAGGLAALLIAIGGSIFTAVKTSPTGGQDKSDGGELSSMSLFIFTITPPLVVLVLVVLIASFSHSMIERVNENPSKHDWPLMISAGVGVLLAFFFAVYEMRRWRDSHWKRALVWFFAIAVVSNLLGFTLTWLLNSPFQTGGFPKSMESCQVNPLALLVVIYGVGGIVLFRFLAFKKPWFEWLRRRDWLKGFRVWVATIVAYGVIITPFVYLTHRLLSIIEVPAVCIWPTGAFVSGLFFVAIATVLELILGDNLTERSAWLLAASYILLVALLVFSFFTHSAGQSSHASLLLGYSILGLLAMALAWVIALGWMADPNLLSLHLFYKNRLVRAYLGASNGGRDTQEITQAAEGDDLLLSMLRNCEKGAPYHLINTTLNLVGGRDLATAQRSSAAFLLSRNFCGSARTGFRKTEKYMDGRFSLGTAVAVSGAALSPSMGTKNQTASLAMLMTLLNIRLGYWTPTPNKGNWQSSHARLWPFYMLYEFLSQTNDLSSFSYLTDGGHFDNTGLYSLVERGCRFIVLIDNGADPKPCFEDLGDAIRRCRIDFKAEIDLDIRPCFKSEEKASKDNLSQSHYVVGEITYSPDHLHEINWSQSDIADEKKRKGIIVLIKPSLIDDDSPDLRQYHRQNKDFPQQSTAKQWFDEAQFESYRKLGAVCGRVTFGNVAGDTGFIGAVPLDGYAVHNFFEELKKQFEKRNLPPRGPGLQGG